MDGFLSPSSGSVKSSSPFISHEESLPPILTLEEVAAYFDRKPNTIYEWKAKGLLDNACRKRGKHLFFWRDKVIKLRHEIKDHKDGFR